MTDIRKAVLSLRDETIKRPSLRMYTPIAQGDPPDFDADLTTMGADWRRSIKGKGGYWNGSFTITPEDMSAQDMSQFFYEKLAFHVIERSGAETWEGLVYEMEFTHNGVTRRRSLDLMENYVWATYVTPDDPPVVNNTSVAKNDESIARYGRKEELILMDGYWQSAAQARRDTHLNVSSWPWARVLGVKGLKEEERYQTVLTVFCVGYVYTANWRYQQAGGGIQDEVSDWIILMIGTDCEFLTAGKIERNTVQVYTDPPIKQKVWDLISELLEMGNANGDPYRFFVGLNQIAEYTVIDKEPRYFLRDGRLYPSPGSSEEVDPWNVEPAVVRDMTYQFAKEEYDSWFDDARDFYMSEVEVGMGTGLVIKTEVFDESEFLAAQLAAKNQIKKAKERKKAEEEAARLAKEQAE